LTALSLVLSASETIVVWLLGQGLLAFALLQWFVLLHECGHKTLFRSKWIHRWLGHLAAFFAVIPFHSWKKVHAMHHKWTGWQDLDPTTESLVPRELGRFEKLLTNFCWKYGIPLFAVIYRVNNFWNLPRLNRMFRRPTVRLRIVSNIALLALAYAVTVWLVGFGQLIRLCGLGLLLSLMLQEWLILSQHTHIPQQLSHGRDVQPYTAVEQEPFTRSLRFPGWFSISVLINVDAHELHHMYPFVPAYHLHRITYATENAFGWWQWLRTAKRIPGEVFLFQNRNETGFDV
jgi:fatty acid desaturase